MLTFNKEGQNMAAYTTYGNTASNCCKTAAACSSARISPLLDTAAVLVVSICIRAM